MTKKTSKANRDPRKRSSVSSVSPRSYSDMFKDRSEGVAPATPAKGANGKAAVQPSVPLKGSDSVNWTRDYTHVLRDLRWLFILSGVLLAAIVAASFFL